MAPMDGAEVLRGIRRTREGEQLPVIAYSASLIGFTRKEALEMGCDDWLPKPFTPEDLFAKLGRLLNLQWEYRQAAAAAAPAGAYRFRREDLETLRALAYRREPVGLKTALEAIRDREPASAGTVAPMLALAARFRLGEVSGQLETMEARVEPS